MFVKFKDGTLLNLDHISCVIQFDRYGKVGFTVVFKNGFQVNVEDEDNKTTLFQHLGPKVCNP